MEEVRRVSMGRIFESSSTVQGDLLRLEVVVLLSALILAALVLYGSAHRRSSDKLLRGAMWMAYSMSYVVVSYAVGIIQDGPFHGETFVLWATALLLIQASAYSAPVHSRRDVGQRKKLLLQHVLQTGLVLWLIANATGSNPSYRAAIWAFWALNVLKTAAKIVEMIQSSRPDVSVKVVAEYMAVEDRDDRPPPPNPVTMQGYRYIFHGEETMLPPVIHHDGGGRPAGWEEMLALGKSVVTIDQVYKWIDRQPGSSEVEKDKTRDFCLAFALFKLLKRRFYGYVPAEAGSRKARDLVLTGLIHAGATGPDAAFRVVESELAFLYDFFYTRNIVLVGAKTYICIAVAVAGLATWTAFFGTLGPGYRRPHIGVRDLDRSVTVMIVAITAGLEVFQAAAGFASNWRYVKTLYRCVRDARPWSRRRWRGHHLWWNESIAPPETRYWEEKVGQYELLKRFRHRPFNLLSWMTLYLVEPRRQGQKRGRRKPLPPEVRRAVLLKLKESDCELSNGVAALRRHRLLPRLAWACKLPMFTDQILVWHIVTTCCDWASGRPERRRGAADADVNRLVARKLSNYCAYLVAFVPEMLPDPSYNTEQIFDTAVQQARDHLDGCRSHAAILTRLEEIADFELQHLQEEGGTYERASGATVIERAAVLWRQLRAGTVSAGERTRRWQVLAEFWAEFVLFLAPSDNVDIHAEMLGAGGEFMTQLWALLSHAGVLERPPGQGSRGGRWDNLLDLLPRESEQRRATAN